ncbi:MAG: hypothetical protein ACFCD0_10610 [Gemmataceae bacterium]
MRSILSLIMLFVVAVVASGQEGKEKPFPGKYMLPDADFVVMLNLKQFRNTPIYKKHHKKDLEKLVGLEPVAQMLRELGLNPLQDIDHVCMAEGRSCFSKDKREGPYVVVRGRFDSNKLQAAAKK